MSDPDTAGEATDRLVDLAAQVPAPALAATADTALRHPAPRARRRAGSRRRPPARLRHLAGPEAPYEAARSRAAYGLALRAVGREDDAAFELDAARAAFERLGAAPDAAQVAASIGGPHEPPLASPPGRSRSCAWSRPVGPTGRSPRSS